MKKRNKLKLLKLINSNKRWRETLSAPPYNLTIKEDGDYILIKYNQLFSDLSNKIVQEARGLIIKKKNGKYTPVCMPFTKFFCFGDPNAKPDLKKLYHRNKWCIEEKIDGSLIKLWYDNGAWHISTNGTINAECAEVQFAMHGINNYKDLFLYASKDKIDYSKLDKQFTYMFELIGMENKVIVPYDIEDIYYLGRRNNYTLYEVPYAVDDCLGVQNCKRPKYKEIEVHKNPYKLMKSIQSEVDSFTKETEHFEGYVISDISLKTRIKMKSSQYMELFFKKGNGIFTPRKILLMILDSKDDDILSSFPEYKPQFDIVRRAFCEWLEKVKEDLKYMDKNTWETKKDFAEWAKQTTCSAIIFSAYGKNYWEDNWLENTVKNIQIDKLVKYINIEERKGEDYV